MWPCGDDLLRVCSYSFQLLVVPSSLIGLFDNVMLNG